MADSAVTTPAPVSGPASTFPANMTPDPNSIVDTLKTMGMDSSHDNIGTLYEKAGLGTKASYLVAGSNNGQQNTALNNYYKTGAGKPTSVGIVTSNQSRSDYNNNVTKMNQAVGTVTPPVAQTPTEIADKTGQQDPNYDANGNYIPPALTPDKTTPPAGLDPTLTKQYQDSIDSLTTEATGAKATLDAALATLQNDPAATAAVNAISDKYNVLIENMNAKNKVVLGGFQTGQARSGGLQYANELSTSFMSSEMDRANQRVADLVTQEQDLILKTQQAYKNGDVKALAEAQKNYDDVNKQKFDEINKLAVATNNAVKTSQADLKQAQTEKNQTITNDIKLSANVAQSVVDQIKTSGVTDKATIDSFINQVAQNNGISNAEVLRSAVLKAQQTNETLNLKNENIVSTIQKRNQPKVVKPKTKTDGGFTYTQDDLKTGSDFLNKGGKGPDGTVYGGKGDTYVNTGTYIALYKNWGGTPKGFLKEYPVKDYVNPDDYSSLPANIRPKPAATTQQAPPQ